MRTVRRFRPPPRKPHPLHGVGGNPRPVGAVSGPTAQEARVLACVYSVPQRSGEIAARAGLTTSQAHNALARLKSKGLVRSTRGGWVQA